MNAAYALIDLTNLSPIATFPQSGASGYGAAGALAWIQFANIHTATLPLDDASYWRRLDAAQLGAMFTACMRRPVPPPPEDALPQAREALRSMIAADTRLVFPFKFEHIEIQALHIHIDDERPYLYDPNSKTGPRLADAWARGPQVNRSRKWGPKIRNPVA